MDDSYISLGDLGNMTIGGEMSSLPYGGSTLEEERPGSSLSNASRSSRIPVFTRSHSLRVKSSATTHTQDGTKVSSKAGVKGRADGRPSSRASTSVGRGLVRSASFVSSRGMKGLSSPSSPSTTHPTHHTSSRQPLTPETPRRPSHASAHVKRSSSSVTDRKSHSYAGIGSSWHHHSPSYHHHHHHLHHNSHSLLHHYHSIRRPNFLPVTTASSSSQFSSLPTTPASQPETPSRSPDSNDLDDADSVKSFGSVSSAVSCDAALTPHSRHQGQACGGAGNAPKGGRSFKYVLHCRHNHGHDPEQYLTPTQRAARRIRELKTQLSEARREVQQRDTEIARLTRELVELRLLKARTPHWEDEEEEEEDADADAEGGDKRRGGRDKVDGKVVGVAAPAPPTHTRAHANAHATSKTSSTPSEGSEPELRRLMENISSGAAAPQEPPAGSPAGGSVAETTADSVDLIRSSLADSGHYDDLTSPSLSSRDPMETSRGSLRGHHTEEEEEPEEEEEAEEAEEEEEEEEEGVGGTIREVVEEAERRIREEFERHEEMLKRNHLEEYHELKEKHNDKVEALLSKLSDANLKYFELRPLYDQSQERTRELERDVMRLKEELTEAELRHQKMYLQMFLKGQQAARIQAEDDLDGVEEGLPTSLTSSGPMVELMRQLTRTEEELEKVKALYHREVNCRNNNHNNNNNNNNGTSGRRNGELDPEVTLQFLKSAIYYFFTDRDNAKGHLRAIESILGYSDSERYNIGKVIK